MGKKQINLFVSCDSFEVEHDRCNYGIMLIELKDVDAYFLAKQLGTHEDFEWLLENVGIERVIKWVKDNGFEVTADE